MARSKKNPEGGHESVSAEPSEAPEVIEETPEVVAEVPEDLPVGAEIQVEGKVKPREKADAISRRIQSEREEIPGALFAVVSKTGVFMGIADAEAVAVELCDEIKIQGARVIRVRPGARVKPEECSSRYRFAGRQGGQQVQQLPTQGERRAFHRPQSKKEIQMQNMEDSLRKRLLDELRKDL